MKKLLSVLLCVAMILTIVPIVAFAGDGDPVLAESIALDKAELLLFKGDSAELEITPTPEEAEDTFTWESSAEDVATVEGGIVTAVAAGTATITAKGETDGVSATCTVTVYDENNSCAKIADKYYYTIDDAIDAAEESATITLLKDCEDVDFDSKTIEIDLNDFFLSGASENSDNVTIVNNGINGKCALSATGTYANDVKSIVADGFDAKEVEGKYEVFANTDADLYTIKVVTSTEDDRDMTNDGEGNREFLGNNQYGPLTTYEGKNVDVYAGDIVNVEIRVYGPRFVAGKVLLAFNDDDFSDVTEDWSDGWEPDTKTGGYIFYQAKGTSGYWEPSLSDALDVNTDEEGKQYYVLGSFDFEVNTVNESYFTSGPSLKEMFEVSTEDAYIAGAWKDGWDSNPANKVDDVKDDFANIRLIPMKASIQPRSGLIYSDRAQNLLENTYSATDSNTGEAVTGCTISYAVLTKAEADGGATPVYGQTLPQGLNAGDYVAYYRVAKPGYITVEKSEVVTIKPFPVSINWVAESFNNSLSVAKPETVGDCNFWVSYDGNDFEEPYATFQDPYGTTITITADDGDNAPNTVSTPYEGKVERVSGAAEGLSKVGTYVYEASLGANFIIDENTTTPTKTTTLIIDGGMLKGYDLINNDANGDDTVDEKDKTVWYDNGDHLSAVLTVAEDATEADGTEVTKTYSISKDGGKTWIDPTKYEENGITLTEDGVPVVSKVGKYTVKAVLSADSYYDKELTVSFEIKTVEYYVEVSDFVSGWDFVQVYTNESVEGFTYDGHYMYDISRLGYDYHTTFNAQGTVTAAGTHFTHVYGVLVAGVGDENLVTPSNDAATIHELDPEKEGGEVKATKGRDDVNQSDSYDIFDLVAVQGVYNVNTVEFLNDAKMHVALKCDVTGNKTVDMADYTHVKAASR